MAVLRLFSFKTGLLAVASLLFASNLVLAGGGHGGGHGGGIGHVGGYGLGYGIGMGYGGYGPGFLSGRGYGLGYGIGYGYGGYGLGYGLGYGGYYPSYYSGYPYSSYGYGFGVPYVGGSSLYTTPGITGYSSAYPPVQQQQAAPKDDAAHLLVIVPEDAELWFNGTTTTQKGTQRVFVSPPLTPGKRYTYEIKTRWMRDGKPVEEVRNVPVQANDWQRIDLTKPEPPAVPEK